MRVGRDRRLSVQTSGYWACEQPSTARRLSGADGSPLRGEESAEQWLRDVDQSGSARDPRVRGSTTTTAKAAGEFAEKTPHASLRAWGTVGRRGVLRMNTQKDGQLMGQRRREDVA